MNITDIDRAAKMKAELQQWQGSLYNLRRLIKKNSVPSTETSSVWNRIRLWFDNENGKHIIRCGQPAFHGMDAGCSEKFEINAEQLAVFCDFIEQITEQKKVTLMELIGDA